MTYSSPKLHLNFCIMLSEGLLLVFRLQIFECRSDGKATIIK
jgi:hypothetical protein